MKIVKNNSLINTGYSKGFQMLTNFVFEIISVEYRDNLYGYFTIKMTNNNKTFVRVEDLSICGISVASLRFKFLEFGNNIFHPEITHSQILDIFSYEFNQYKISEEIKKLQNDQLAYGNQSVALEKATTISSKDKQTLRAYYSTQQNELQERINELTLELSVVGSETIIAQTH